MTMPATSSPAVGTGRRWASLAVLLLPVLLVSIDNTVLSFALPAISTALSPTSTQLLWTVDIYALVLAGLLVPAGALGDRIGRRKLLLIGATGFAGISALAAFATDAAWLIAARAALGIFGAMLMPSTLSLIRNIFTNAAERRTAIAIWASAFSGGAVLGPVVGGLLLEHFWFGSVFLMAVPVLLPLLVAGPLLIPESRDPHPGRVDPLSIALVILALVPFTYAVKSFSTSPWPLTAGLLALSAVSIFCFTRHQLASSSPMIDVRLFKHAPFSGALLVNLIGVFSLTGFIYFVSQHLQLVAGYSPFASGLLMTPGLVLTMAFGLLAVALSRKFGSPNVMILGLGFSALSYLMVIFSGTPSSLPMLMAAFCVLGIGIGLTETLSNDMVLAAVPPQKAGAASAISETAYEVGSVLGVAVLGTIVNTVYSSHMLDAAQLGAPALDTASETLAGAHQVASTLDPAAAQQLLDTAASSFDAGVLATSCIAVILSLAAAVVVQRLIKKPAQVNPGK